MGANDPRCVANLDPKGLNCKIYVGDYQTLLHTQYISCGPHGFREEVGANDSQGVANSDPRGMVGKDVCRRQPNIVTY